MLSLNDIYNFVELIIAILIMISFSIISKLIALLSWLSFFIPAKFHINKIEKLYFNPYNHNKELSYNSIELIKYKISS